MNEAVVNVAPGDSVSEAARKMEEEAYSQLAVIQDGIPVGSISQTDLVHLDSEDRDEPVEEHMSESFPTVSKDATLDDQQPARALQSRDDHAGRRNCGYHHRGRHRRAPPERRLARPNPSVDPSDSVRRLE